MDGSHATGRRGPPAGSFEPEALFPFLGAVRDQLRAGLDEPAWQVKDNRGFTPAMWARYLLALWGDPRDDATTRRFLAERKDFARAAPAGLEGKTIDEALARYADAHFAREGYKDAAKRPPSSFHTILAPDGERALVRHWVEYLHWGYAQELALARRGGKWRVRLVMFRERWHKE